MINSCLALLYYKRLEEVQIHQWEQLGWPFLILPPTKITFSQFYTVEKTAFTVQGHFVIQFVATTNNVVKYTSTLFTKKVNP